MAVLVLSDEERSCLERHARRRRVARSSRDDRQGILRLDHRSDPFRVVGLFGENKAVGRQLIVEQRPGEGAVVGLAEAQGEAQRQAAGIDHGMDLRRQSASGTAHATIWTPLSNPAACWRILLPLRPAGRSRTAAIQKIPGDAGGDPRRRGLDRIPLQMRIARRGPDLAVAEQLRDHGQALAKRQRPRSEAVTAVMNPHFLESRPFPYDPPRAVQVGHVRARLLAGDNPGAVRKALQFLQHPDRRRRQRNRARTRLAVGKPEFARRQVHIPPFE